jgi:hypothetical protein
MQPAIVENLPAGRQELITGYLKFGVGFSNQHCNYRGRVNRNAVRRHINYYSRAIEKKCYSNDLENIDIYLAGIYSLVRNSFYISAKITLYAVSNQVG